MAFLVEPAMARPSFVGTMMAGVGSRPLNDVFEKWKAAQAAQATALKRSTLTAMINVVEGHSLVVTPLRIGRTERAIYQIDQAGLFETLRGPGHWSGHSSGISVPVGLGIHMRVGQSRGRYVQGTEALTVIDTGSVTFTTNRVVFLGRKFTRAWDFSKLLGVEHDSRNHRTAIQVSNRQKTSGFTYPGVSAALVADWLELAIDLGTGDRPAVSQRLKQQLQAIAPPPPSPLAPADYV